jgi:hypothetical protein
MSNGTNDCADGFRMRRSEKADVKVDAVGLRAERLRGCNDIDLTSVNQIWSAV